MSKPALVLLHGWGVNRCVWTNVAERLRPQFRVLALDLPGYAVTTDRAPEGTDLAGMAGDLLAAAPAAAIWLGWSLGGMVALKAAHRAPHRVTRLVLVGTTPRFVCGPNWEHGVDARQVAAFAADLAVDYQRTVARFLLLQAGTGAAARAVARALARRITACGAPGAAALQDSLKALVGADLRADLPGIVVPARVIHGAEDRLTPVGAARYLARHLPAAQLSVIPGAGHAPFMLAPDAFSALIAEAAA